MSELSFELHLGFGNGVHGDMGRWENQHGKGVYFTFSFFFLMFEFRTDGPL